MEQDNVFHLEVDQMLEISCTLCASKIKPGQERIVETVEQGQLILCMTCQSLFLLRLKSKPIKNDTLELHYPDGVKMFGLISGECQICDSFGILIRSSLRCEHYLCQLCLFNLIRQFARNKKAFSLKCPFADCKIILSEYLTLQFSQEIIKKIQGRNSLICPSKQCKVQYLTVEVDKDFTNKNLINKDGKILCLECGLDRCGKCHQSHYGSCDIEKEFKKAIFHLNIIKCPKCSQYVQRDQCYDYQKVTCPLCCLEFCFHCQTPLSKYKNTKDECTYCYYFTHGTVAEIIKHSFGWKIRYKSDYIKIPLIMILFGLWFGICMIGLGFYHFFYQIYFIATLKQYKIVYQIWRKNLILFLILSPLLFLFYVSTTLILEAILIIPMTVCNWVRSMKSLRLL